MFSFYPVRELEADNARLKKDLEILGKIGGLISNEDHIESQERFKFMSAK